MKAILKSKFGKPSGFAKAYIENVVSMSVINNTNPGCIHSFMKN